jgi:hypothetical protein
MHDAGDERQARAILIEREDQRLRRLTESGEMGWKERWWQLFIKDTLGFGYQPWKMLGWLAVVWLLGAGLFSLAYNFGDRQTWLGTVTPSVPLVYMESLRNPDADHAADFKAFTNQAAESRLPDYPRFRSIVFSLDALVPLVNLHQENHWTPHGLVRWYMVFHIIAGWVGTTLFVAGFTGIVRRD